MDRKDYRRMGVSVVFDLIMKYCVLFEFITHSFLFG